MHRLVDLDNQCITLEYIVPRSLIDEDKAQQEDLEEWEYDRAAIDDSPYWCDFLRTVVDEECE